MRVFSRVIYCVIGTEQIEQQIKRAGSNAPYPQPGDEDELANLDACAGIGQLSAGCFSLFLRDGFLDRLGRAID